MRPPLSTAPDAELRVVCLAYLILAARMGRAAAGRCAPSLTPNSVLGRSELRAVTVLIVLLSRELAVVFSVMLSEVYD